MKLLILSIFCGFSAISFSQIDLEPIYLGPSHYYNQLGPHELIVTFVQNEADPLTTIECQFQIDNGAIESVSVSNFDIYPNIAQGAINRFTLTLFQTSNNYTFDAFGKHTVKVWLNPVSGTDINPANDTITKIIGVFEDFPEKKILYQFYSHTTCGPCYNGWKRVNKIWNDYPDNVIPISIHNANGSDPYEIPEGEILDTSFTYAHPTLINDQFLFPWFEEIDPLNGYDYWDTTRKTVDRLKFLYPLDLKFITKDWDDGTRNLEVEVKITVYDTLLTPHSLNYWIVEDSVQGYQASAPDPNNYWHRNILRAMPYGPWGDPNILPDTLYPGEVYYDQLTYNLPANYNEEQATIIATVQGYHPTDVFKRDIRVTEWVPFMDADFVTGIEKEQSDQFYIYPNPTEGMITVSGIEMGTQYTIIDVIGKLHTYGIYNGPIELELSPGLYIFQTNLGHQPFVLK